MKYTVTIGEKKNLGNYENLHVEISEEFDSEATSKDVAYDIVANKLDYFMLKRLMEIHRRKKEEATLRQKKTETEK